MRIDSKVNTNIGKVQILIGSANYPLNHRDPIVATALRALRDAGFVLFGEVLEGDKTDDDGQPDTRPESAGETTDPDLREGALPKVEKKATSSKRGRAKDKPVFGEKRLID